MKIAVPVETADGLNAPRSGHFGHAAYFTIAYIEDGKVEKVESVQNVDHDIAGCGGVIQHAIDLKIDGLIAAGMGRPPFMRFSEAGIKVYFDQTQPFAGGVIDLFLAGKLEPMSFDQTCVH